MGWMDRVRGRFVHPSRALKVACVMVDDEQAGVVWSPPDSVGTQSTKGLVMRCEWEPEQVSPTEPSWAALKNKVDEICGPTRALEFADTSDLDRREHPGASEAIEAVEMGNPSARRWFGLRRHS